MRVQRRRLYLLNLVVLLIAVVERGQGAVVREVEGGAVAVGRVEGGHLQVLRLVQRRLPAAEVGAGVRVGQQGLHLPRLAPPVEAGGPADAGPAGATALRAAVPRDL